MLNKKVTFLDCTFRDGGYYNNWDFDHALAANYLCLCDQINVDIVEIGYVRLMANSYGAFGDLPDQVPSVFLDQLPKLKKLRLAAMVDGKEFVNFKIDEINAVLKNRFANSKLQLDLLRVAIHFSLVHKLIPYLQRLEQGNFPLAINLMQIDLATENEIAHCIQALSMLTNVTVVYLADSLGAMQPAKVQALITRFKEALNFDLGFHAHDNMGLALHNSLVALEQGATWIDGTFYGIGRGSGNAKTEQLLPFLRPNMPETIQQDLYCFIATHFHNLRERFNWGSSVFYTIAGFNRIHPSYIQQIEESQFSVREKLRILTYLKQTNATSFSQQVLAQAFTHV